MVRSQNIFFEFTAFSSDTLSFYLSNLFSHVVSIFSCPKLYERYILIMSGEKDLFLLFQYGDLQFFLTFFILTNLRLVEK